jgi:hypothetical protein
VSRPTMSSEALSRVSVVSLVLIVCASALVMLFVAGRNGRRRDTPSKPSNAITPRAVTYCRT